jgi:tetratricopeptide (TPR) repeat protein
MAVHCDPSQGDYHAHLGYALYRSNPGVEVLRREALEHVAKGVKLAPGREKPLLFLGRIFRESGEIATAAKVLRRALELSPDSPALVQEMCLIQGTTKRSNRGFLARFRKR